MKIDEYACTNAAGFSGTRGEVDIDECAPKPCLNGAACVDQVNAYACKCAYGYSGTTCETTISQCGAAVSNDCAPAVNGVKVSVCTSTGAGTHSCGCVPGYTGDGKQCSDANECASTPCQNGGACTESTGDATIAIDAYACANKAGYSGVNGATDVDECASTPCKNSGAWLHDIVQ